MPLDDGKLLANPVNIIPDADTGKLMAHPTSGKLLWGIDAPDVIDPYCYKAVNCASPLLASYSVTVSGTQSGAGDGSYTVNVITHPTFDRCRWSSGTTRPYVFITGEVGNYMQFQINYKIGFVNYQDALNVSSAGIFCDFTGTHAGISNNGRFVTFVVS